MAQRRDDRKIALTIALAYAALGGIWVAATELLLGRFDADGNWLTVLRIGKGWFFVAATSALLYAVIRRFVRREFRALDRFESLIEATTDGVWWSDGLSINLKRTVRAEEFGGPPLVRLSLEEWWKLIHPDELRAIQAQWHRSEEAGTSMDLECRMYSKDGYYRWGHLRGLRVRSLEGDDFEWIGTIADIHERKAAEQALRESAESMARIANQDDLTGLPNRRLMRDMLVRSIRDASAGGSTVALMMMDLDHFKLVNDTLGHAAGDRLLCEAANRLSGCVRDQDRLARLGGDEFTVLLTDVENEETVARIAGRIVAAMDQPFELDGREVSVTATLGIAMFPRNAGDADGLQRRADLALYAGKAAGRSVFRFYSPELEARSIRRMQIETGLRKAVERGEIELRMRPMFEFAEGALVAVDVEAWWRHPQLGLLAPIAYRQVAEESRQGESIGDFVIDETLRNLARWQALGLPMLRAPLHVSARRLADRSLARTLNEKVLTNGLRPEYVIVSFSENELSGRSGDVVGVLDALSRQGFRIAIERFGTGSSSIADLKRFPLNAVRIDASFVRDIPGDGDDATIVRSMIGLAHNFGVSVMADGVDGPQQAAFLRDNGCDVGTGQYWSQPMRADLFDAWLLSYCDASGRTASR